MISDKETELILKSTWRIIKDNGILLATSAPQAFLSCRKYSSYLFLYHK